MTESRRWQLAGFLVALLGLLVALGTWLYPDIDRRRASQRRIAYVKEVEPLCQQTIHQLMALGPPPTEPADDPIAQARWLESTLPIRRALAVRWRSIRPPDGDEADVGQILNLLEQHLSEFDEALRSLRAGNINLANSFLQRGRDLGLQKRQAAVAYGFRDCQNA
jgi:hypothetical protein